MDFEDKNVIQLAENFAFHFHKRHLNCVTVVRDVRLPPQCKWDIRSSGMLRGVYWWLVTDVSGQPIGLVFKGQTNAWPLKMGPILCPETSVNTHLRCVTLQKTFPRCNLREYGSPLGLDVVHFCSYLTEVWNLSPLRDCVLFCLYLNVYIP
jgi:hypothetical protein